MLKTFFLTLILICLGILGWFFWNNASIIQQEGSIESMTQEEYKVFTKKALSRNTASRNYIVSKGKVLLNSGYISDSPKNWVNEQNVTVWYTDTTTGEKQNNPKTITVWIQGVSGILESNMDQIEAEQKRDQKQRDARNLSVSSKSGNTGNKLLWLVGNFPQSLGDISSGSSGGAGSIWGSTLGSKLETESDDIKSTGISKLEVWGEQVNGGSLYNQIIDISENLPENGEKYYKTYVNR
jgi:hypothetical protein